MRLKLTMTTFTLLLLTACNYSDHKALPTAIIPATIGARIQPTQTAKVTLSPTLTSTPTPTFTATIAQTSAPTAPTIWTPVVSLDAEGVPIALVPAGSFEMGGVCYRDSCPLHEVSLDAFYIDIYEATNSVYARCVSAGICQPPSQTTLLTGEIYYGNPTYDNYPVNFVSWDDAKIYCEWRDARLPTEAEWEKAARGGLDGKKYPWGDNLSTCEKGVATGANKWDCNHYAPVEVGSYSPNGFGVYDMAGNMQEWVADWFDKDYYLQSPAHNPTGPATGQRRVLRSGPIAFSVEPCYVYARYEFPPYGYDIDIGIRCARTPDN